MADALACHCATLQARYRYRFDFCHRRLPLELQVLQTNATTPVIYALGTLTAALSLGVIICCLLVVLTIQHRRTRFR